jgi:hypothetical protein
LLEFALFDNYFFLCTHIIFPLFSSDLLCTYFPVTFPIISKTSSFTVLVSPAKKVGNG